MTEREVRITYQQEQLAQRQAELEAAQKANEEYMQTEAYEREQHERYEDMWEAKAKREGFAYTRKPFIGALERAQQAEQAKQREIAALKERLAVLENK